MSTDAELMSHLRRLGLFGDAVSAEAADRLAVLIAERDRLEEALEFYADPEEYHAIAFAADPPCGGFADDFDEDHGHPDYDRHMAGKRARAALSPTQEKGE